MTSKPFSAHCTNMFEETHMTTEPRNIGAENLYFSQSQSRRIIDTTLTSISANPLQNYNVPSPTMNNGDSALHNPCINYAQPSPVAGGGFLFSFASPQPNYLNMFNTGQNINYGHQQPNYPNNYQFTNKSNTLSSHQNPFSSFTCPTTLQENTQKENPFKLQFHLQRSTSTSDLPEMKINSVNDDEMAFVKKMTDLHHIWRDRSDMCSKLSHFDPFQKYGINKVLHLSKSPDLKAKKGKFYEIDISQECDVCQNNISQTLQLFENERKGLFVNKTCMNNDEFKAKEKKERTETTTTATETSTDLKDESLQTESKVWDKNVPMDVSDDLKTDNEEAFLENLKKSSVFDGRSSSLKNFRENYSDENIEEMLNKKVKNLLNYFPRSILRKFKLLETEITNLLLKTMQMSEEGKCIYSDQDLEEIIQKEETGLQPKNFDRNLLKCLTNKGRAEKRHFSKYGSDDDIFEFQKTNKMLRLTKSTDLVVTSQNRNELEPPKEIDKLRIDDDNIECKTLSDKSVSCKQAISNLKPKSLDTKPIETICLDNKTKSENSLINTKCISSQILSQADDQIQKWHDIIIKKLQMFENGIREVFMNTKHFSLNCSDITQNPVINEVNSTNTDTVSYIGSFLDKIITLQKSPDILDKINKLEEEVTGTPKSKTRLNRNCDKNDSMDLDDVQSKATEEKSKCIDEKTELIIPEESLRPNHGLEINRQRVTSEIKLPPNCSTGVMDFDNLSLKTSKRKLCETDPIIYSQSFYSPSKKANVDFERKTVSENYIQGFWKSSEKYHYTPKYNKTKTTGHNVSAFGSNSSNQSTFNLQKSSNSTDIKNSIGFIPTFNIKKSVSEIVNNSHTSEYKMTPLQESVISKNNDDDQTETVSQVDDRKSISKIIDDIHTQIWGSDKNPTFKSHYFAKNFKKSNSFDKYKHSQTEQIKRNAMLILRPEFDSYKIKSETGIVATSSKYQLSEDSDSNTLRKNNSSGYGTSSILFQKSKFHEDTKSSNLNYQNSSERRSNTFIKSKFLDDFHTASKTSPKSHSRNFEKHFSLLSKSKFREDFEMSKSIVDAIINKACDDSDTKQFQLMSTSNQKDHSKFSSTLNVAKKSKMLFREDDERTTSPRKSKSLTSINEETELSEKSTERQINPWQNKIPRAFAKENKELSKSKMHLFDNWRKKLQENKRGSSKSNLYQRPSFKKKVPRAVLSDDSKTEIEVSLESYDKSTREMEKKLNEALLRYNKTAKVTDKISKKFMETSDKSLPFPTVATPRTFLADNEQIFLTKVENALKAKLNGNFKISEVQSGQNNSKPYYRDNSTMEPSTSFDDEEIRSVEYSRSYVIQNADENDKDEKYCEN
ncbi:uncharacterized protein LOC112906283 isoform X4 [Agrilus planipennis]|uniref:Uncharacterized protein LOC112906283 isoform X3 n=1 Tax=Agrilus planipennis TaxID=224129 RepID=A0A7F5RIW4_AGRPL|nr:uncharacterized protein LOC112906283 isoform X3 [Agrilus planipennis]XP_025835948.1 uncharacterized protein LOC112906283 isoform X4 [Agrilus planipennis]